MAKKKKSKKFNTIVGIISIIGVVATIIFGLHEIFSQKTDAQYVINSGEYVISGENIIIATYYQDHPNETTPVDVSESVLYKKLKENVDEEILCFIQDDFDNDEKEEAFAFVGKYDDELLNGVWDGSPLTL